MFIIRRCLVNFTNEKYLLKYSLPKLSTFKCRNMCQLESSALPEPNFDEKITKIIRSNHGIMYDHHLPKFLSICKQIQTQYELEDEVIIKCVNRQPGLTSYSVKQWKTCIETLTENGLDIKTVFKVLSTCPQVLQMSHEYLWDIFTTLRKFGLAGKHLKHVISGAPALLITDAKFLSQQFQHLLMKFPNSDIKKLVWMCPNILFDDIEETEEKLTYIVHEMRVKHEEIASSTVLSLSLNHIKKRFEFLVRTGFYRKVHPKLTVNNPSLVLMMETPLRQLVEKHVGIQWEEFLAFEKMFQKELEENEKKSDSEEESDDEDD